MLSGKIGPKSAGINVLTDIMSGDNINDDDDDDDEDKDDTKSQ